MFSALLVECRTYVVLLVSHQHVIHSIHRFVTPHAHGAGGHVVAHGERSYSLLVKQQLYNNHLYLLATLLLLTLADSGACWSLDARRRGMRSYLAAWPASLLKWQVSVVYGFAALAKINTVYLSGAVSKSQFALAPAWFMPTQTLDALFPLLAVLSIVMEGFLAGGLWRVRWRYVALLVGVALHGFGVVAGSSTPFTALELGNFALITMAPYVLFL